MLNKNRINFALLSNICFQASLVFHLLYCCFWCAVTYYFVLSDYYTLKTIDLFLNFMSSSRHTFTVYIFAEIISSHTNKIKFYVANFFFFVN
jgi:hypothetical protein